MHAWEVMEEEEYGCMSASQVTTDEEKSKIQYAFFGSYVRRENGRMHASQVIRYEANDQRHDS